MAGMDRSNKQIVDLISRMTLDQKVGSLMTLGFAGTVVTPDVRDEIVKYHCGGFRLSPRDRFFGSYIDPKSGKTLVKIANTKGLKKEGFPPPAVTPSEYKEILRELQSLAMDRPGGIPLHYSLDQEGGAGIQYNFGGVNVFPRQMGIRATGEPKLAYESALATARQCRAVGFNWVHLPVLDIGVNPDNPDLYSRPYSDRAEEVAEYAAEACKGLREGGLIAAGKHFPGFGDCAASMHYGMPVVNVDKDTLMNRELLPYKALIEQKLLPTIMLAHCIYPAIDEKDIATVSRPIITDLLREKLGFEGVVTTDSMTMVAIAKRYGIAEACAMAIAAGADLALMKAENELIDETFSAIKKYVEEGKIGEGDLDDKIYRQLNLKYEYGLFDDGGISDVIPEDVIKDEKIVSLCRSVARRSVLIARDRKKILPLSKDERILVIEQMTETPNNIHWHPGLLFKNCLQCNANANYLETAYVADEEDKATMRSRIKDFNTVIATNYYKREQSNNEMLREILKNKGKKVVVVTNTPYRLSIPDEADTVVVTFGPSPANVEAAVGVLFGEVEAGGEWPIEYKIRE